MARDVKFLKWLEESVSTGKETELSIDKKLHEFRAAQPLYMGESFDTIAGYTSGGSWTAPRGFTVWRILPIPITRN